MFLNNFSVFSILIDPALRSLIWILRIDIITPKGHERWKKVIHLPEPLSPPLKDIIFLTFKGL